MRHGSLAFGLSVLALVIMVRIAWLVVYRTVVAAIRHWRPSLADRLASRDPRGAIVISWSGMRGLVTLATAFALPPQFPGRDLIVLCAFCVVLGTLVIQGLTLRSLLQKLRFEDDGAAERDLSRARVAIIQAGLDSLDDDTSGAATTVREQFTAARKVAQGQHAPQAATKYDKLRLRAITAQREALHRLRAQGVLPAHASFSISTRACMAERAVSMPSAIISRSTTGPRRVLRSGKSSKVHQMAITAGLDGNPYTRLMSQVLCHHRSGAA